MLFFLLLMVVFGNLFYLVSPHVQVAVVEDCIVHNMPPAPRVRRLANYIQAIKGVEALRL